MPTTEQAKRIFCKAGPTLNVAVRGDNLVLVPVNSKDTFQQWIQDYDRVGKLTDNTGRRAFALVNRATGQALVNESWSLKLAPYPSDGSVEITMLWSLGKRLDDGFSEVRSLRNLSKTLNAMGGLAQEGTTVGVFMAEPEYDHTIWKIVPINTATTDHPGTSQLRAPQTLSSADE